MLTIISPAKTLDFDTQIEFRDFSSPELLKFSSELVEILKKESPKELCKLMGISVKLGELNAERYKQWHQPFTEKNARPAILAFKGDVYLGLEAESLNRKDLDFAQKRLRILSGLYGVLKPLDLIQPYRLEMGTRLANPRGKNLYDFWADRLGTLLTEELSTHKNRTLINLASIEYFKALEYKPLPVKVIHPVFKDYSGGTYRVMSFFAKKARGMMSRYMIKNRIDKAEHLKDFDEDGYKFNNQLSTEDSWIFTRKGR